MQISRLQALLLLALCNLLWSGNWVAGRALRDAFDPVSLNFWRWLIATAVLAPFALPALRGKWPLVRRHAGILLLLAASGVAAFHSLVYLGLRSTTTVNAVLLNSSIPLFMLLCSWIIERERIWAGFMSDPDWLKARAESEKNGPIVANITSSILAPTAFSRLR